MLQNTSGPPNQRLEPIIEFESPELLQAWREHPEHREAQRLGRERFYEEYTLQVSEPARESRFKR